MTKIIITLALACLLSGCSSTTHVQETGKVADLDDLMQLYQVDPTQTPDGVNSIRFTALKETAMSVGAQAALAKRSKQMNEILESQEKTLDTIFNFNALLMDDNILPPVLTEGRNTLNQDDPNTLRLADRSYKIIKQAHFVTTPPNWRNYLELQYDFPEKPNRTLLPKNHLEQEVWEEYILNGWEEGLQQARTIFTDNLARLKLDMNGIILYRILLAQHMVSPPYVAKTELGVTGGSDELHVNDHALRITALPSLKPDSSTWKPAVTQ